MAAPVRHVAVIDIGKTHAKLALVDLEARAEIAVRKRQNTVAADGDYPHFPVEPLWQFLVEALAEFGKTHPIDAISVTTHGATAALLDESGELALPILDYEYAGPDALDEEYRAVRPPFAETGSPRLPAGLNLGAQLFWQQRMFAERFARVRHILTYPQYWSYRLTGVLATEVTSFGCHTDLWNAASGDFSSMVRALGWTELFAPVRLAGDRLGTLGPELAAELGLSPQTPVFCGIHDSNASLLPHLLTRKPPFAVVSTGTWVISMSIGGSSPTLDPDRDTLINVNAFGLPVPSARFMGGREFTQATAALPDGHSEQDLADVLGQPILLLPSLTPRSGPFPHAAPQWLPQQPTQPGRQRVAVSFYLALMTATCLELTGAQGPIIVEGPFAANDLFLRMLSAATGRPVIAETLALTGTSIGAALLTQEHAPSEQAAAQAKIVTDPQSKAYAAAWKASLRSQNR